MKILAFAASNSRQSINKALVSCAAKVLKAEFYPDAKIEILDINDFDIPIFGVDFEREVGEPKAARRFYEKIGSADILLISYAEHNGHYTAFYKNLFDWTSRISKEVYQGKPAVFFSVSTGANGAKSVLHAATTSAEYFGADLKASLSVPSFDDNFDLEKGKLTNDDLQSDLVAALRKLK